MTRKDPVCGMQIGEDDAAGQSEFAGETYYFCSTACKEKFDADPQSHMSQSAGTAGGF